MPSVAWKASPSRTLIPSGSFFVLIVLDVSSTVRFLDDAHPSSSCLIFLSVFGFQGTAGGIFLRLMGLSGLEPPTSRLSGVRSNRLSYKPRSMSKCADTCCPAMDACIRELDCLWMHKRRSRGMTDRRSGIPALTDFRKPIPLSSRTEALSFYKASLPSPGPFHLSCTWSPSLHPHLLLF